MRQVCKNGFILTAPFAAFSPQVAGEARKEKSENLPEYALYTRSSRPVPRAVPDLTARCPDPQPAPAPVTANWEGMYPVREEAHAKVNATTTDPDAEHAACIPIDIDPSAALLFACTATFDVERNGSLLGFPFLQS